jgi:hypothetical protein
LKAEEPPLCVIARPGIKLLGRDRISARDLLGGYLAGRGSAEDSHLSARRPPHIYICIWKTIGPLRIVGHVSPLANTHWSRQTCVSSIETSKPAKYSMFGLLSWWQSRSRGTQRIRELARQARIAEIQEQLFDLADRLDELAADDASLGEQ